MTEHVASDLSYVPFGENRPENRRFTLNAVAAAFDVAPDRVRRAMANEFHLGPTATLDSTMAQHLAEVILADLPMADRDAALLRLGGYTPRRDLADGPGDLPLGDESDRQAGRPDVPADDLPSARSSYDPAAQSPE